VKHTLAVTIDANETILYTFDPTWEYLDDLVEDVSNDIVEWLNIPPEKSILTSITQIPPPRAATKVDVQTEQTH